MIKIYIEMSNLNDVTNYVYRFKNETPPNDLEEYINNLTPRFTFKENYGLVIEDRDTDSVYNPNINIIETKDSIILSHSIDYRRNIYNYKVISVTGDNKISNLSKTVSCEMTFKNKDVSMVLYKTEDDNIDETIIWEKVKEINVDDVFNLNKKNDIPSSNINVLNSYDIYKDDYLLKAIGERILKIVNPLHINNSDKLYTNPRKFKIVNRKDNTETTKHFLYNPNNRCKITIDKIEIYKREVILDSDKEAIPISGELLLKRFIKRGGIYKDEDGEYINLSSEFLNIKNLCTFAKVYNYTVYLYDERGYISSPIIKIF